HRINVESAAEMHTAAQTCFSGVDAAILCAAVADYRPETVADKKIKREKEEELTLHLRATKDIAAGLGAAKRKDQLLVGFALETNNEQQNAEGKLERKNFDFIVLNSLNDAGAGFRHDTNKISIIDRKGRTDYPLKTKTEVARDIIDHLATALKTSCL
ncbi:phosphopantothenoylcysteine decarboxylase, partial [uncultured Bacteroides sp.]